MAKLLVIYKTPTDVAAFDTYYKEVHLPLAGKMPHVQKVEISKGQMALQPAPRAFISSRRSHMAQ
jgi:uncharacterized protein (TIGR02118 family)